ncbi:MAG TPA: glycosyltransferase [Anaerolineales bacterium]|nr:glycosyltransferase [Anaerolineales bacterium]
MHILFVTLGFYPALAWGGPVKVVYQNSKELIRRGHQVTVYCTNLLNKKEKMSSKTFETDYEGIHVVYFNTWNIASWPGTLGPFWLPDLGAYLEKHIHDFDVIHLMGYRSPIIPLIASKARKAHVPIVTHPQGALPVMVSSFFLKRLYDQVLGKRELQGISSLIALQEIEKQHAIMRGVPPEKIEIIPNGIDVSAHCRVSKPGDFRRAFRLSPDGPLILFLGRVNKIKGVDLLIKSFAQLRDLNTQLAIVGPDDGQMTEIRDLIKELDLEKDVFLTGLVSDEMKSAAYQDADLYVLPSRSDAYPTTVMEACLAEKPMVVTEGCQMAKLIKDRIADVEPFDIDAFASGMRKLLTDRSLYRKYRDNCKDMMKDTFSIEAVVDRLELLYQRVVSEKRSV